MATRYKAGKSPFAVIDLGSSRFACLIAEIGPDGMPKLLGQAIHAAEGRNASTLGSDLLPSRTNNCTPKRFSSVFMFRLKADCVSPNSSEAA